MKNYFYIAMLFLAAAVSGTAHAQIELQIQGVQGEAIEVQEKSQKSEQEIAQEQEASNARKKEQFKAKLGLCIDELKAVCELSDDQVAKLEGAIDAAVAQTMEQHLKQVKAARIDASVTKGFFGFRKFTGRPELVPEDTNAWQSVVAETLTKEQQQQHAAVTAERHVFLRKSIVNVYVAQLADRLLLAPEQHSKLVSFVDEKYGETIYEYKDLITLGMSPESDYEPIVVEDGSPLKGILSAEQLKLWEREGGAKLAAMAKAEQGDVRHFDMKYQYRRLTAEEHAAKEKSKKNGQKTKFKIKF